MPFSGNGAGTQLDPYQLTTLSELNEMYEYDGQWGEAQNEIDCAGANIVSNAINLDINGFAIINIGGAENEFATEVDNIFSGIVKNGELNLNWTTDQSTSVKPVGSTSGGGIQEVLISGQITNNNASGSVYGLAGTLANDFSIVSRDCIVTAHLSAHTNIVGVMSSVQNLDPGTHKNFIFAGQMTDLSGTASLYGISRTSFNASDITDSFWDTQLSGASSSTVGTGKTTAEMQDINTYTDTATTGLDTAYDMVALSSYVNEIWAIDTSSYPVLGWSVDGLKIPSATFTDDNGDPIEGASVIWITETAFAATSPGWNAPAIVGSVYTTDANGVVTYDPNTDPAVDGDKVYTAVARDFVYDSGTSQWTQSSGSDTGKQNVDLTPPA